MTHDIHINVTPGEPDVDLSGKAVLMLRSPGSPPGVGPMSPSITGARRVVRSRWRKRCGSRGAKH